MADIHGVPSESMMIAEQSFMSEPLPDLGAAAAAQRLGEARLAEGGPILSSPQGAPAHDVLPGWTGGWPADVTPSADPDNGGFGGA